MADDIDDNSSDCSSTCSIDELQPSTLDLTSGDYSAINPKLFSILAYNINSITAPSKLDLLEATAHELNLDVIALTETKLNDQIHESVYTIPGYSIVSKHRNRFGGGVLCATIMPLLDWTRLK